MAGTPPLRTATSLPPLPHADPGETCGDTMEHFAVYLRCAPSPSPVPARAPCRVSSAWCWACCWWLASPVVRSAVWSRSAIDRCPETASARPAGLPHQPQADHLLPGAVSAFHPGRPPFFATANAAGGNLLAIESQRSLQLRRGSNGHEYPSDLGYHPRAPEPRLARFFWCSRPCCWVWRFTRAWSQPGQGWCRLTLPADATAPVARPRNAPGTAAAADGIPGPDRI